MVKKGARALNPEFSFVNSLLNTKHPTFEEIARLGAKQMMEIALEAEIQAFISLYESVCTSDEKCCFCRLIVPDASVFRKPNIAFQGITY
jgi:hypothetical protein